MAKLKFITETGMFHVACRCETKGHVQWLGFKPVKHLAPVSPGYVDTSDRTALINHYIVFDIADSLLEHSLTKARIGYAGAAYALAVKDCVSFGADIARGAGLRVPLVNMTPWGFIKTLGVWNKYAASA